MARRIVGIQTERRTVTVPIAGDPGCIESDDCCEGSGSGSLECTEECPACITMSSVWELNIFEGVFGVQLVRIENPNDGNECRFASSDLVWELFYYLEDMLWVLVNYDTEEVWFIVHENWDCWGENTLTYDGEGEQEPAILTPLIDCTGGEYYCMQPPESIVCASCDPVGIPTTLYFRVTGGSLTGLEVVLNWTGGENWYGELIGPAHSPGFDGFKVEMTCGAVGQMTFGGCDLPSYDGPSSLVADIDTCDPFLVDTSALLCSGSATITVSTVPF